MRLAGRWAVTFAIARRVNVKGTTAPAWRPGWHEVGGRRIYFRSLWEKKYACWLDWLKGRGEIRDWQYEPPEFWFDDPSKFEDKTLKGPRRGVVSNRFDFRVIEVDGSDTYYEVKGFMDRKSQTRLRRMKKYYPSVRVVLVEGRDIAEIGFKVGRMVPGWLD